MKLDKVNSSGKKDLEGYKGLINYEKPFRERMISAITGTKGELIDWENDNDFLVQLCKLTGKLLKGGEPDYMTAAKMILHDWQRAKIPFFVPPPEEEERALDEVEDEAEVDAIDDDDEAAAARKGIDDVISSQKIDTLVVQMDLFGEQELMGAPLEL
ncbi:nuclear/nucleolar GTPase 2-like [Salvia divinorum]|uniref:Nuclear/nucleolar GTPase 2-like n=1 Tax=Salvia divinorum TaxID=28513 RepID=A0ABD1IF63_SALDI